MATAPTRRNEAGVGLKVHRMFEAFARMRFAWRAGLQAGGNRDLYQTFGWKRVLQPEDFFAKYIRQDIAQRIVRAYPEALWTDPPLIEADAAFTTAWQNLCASQPVFSELMNADVLAGIDFFSIIVIGLDDKATLDQPVVPKAGRKVLYLQPYPQIVVRITEWDRDQTSPRFGLPTMYRVSPGQFALDPAFAGSTPSTIEGFNVHWTRVVHIIEGRLESRVYGHSRLESVFNTLDDLLKVAGGSSETFWLTANRGIHADVDKDMDLGGEDADALSDEVDDYVNNLSRVLKTRGVKVNALGSDTADPSNNFDVLMSLIAATCGIPKRVLMGSEAGQLASQQDRANWAERVQEKEKNYGQPVILIPFLAALIMAGVLPVPQGLTITWPDPFKMNPLERAQTSAQMARSAANLSKTLKTVLEINVEAAKAALPTVTPASGGIGGGFGGGDIAANADPTQSGGGGTSKPPAQQPDGSSTPPDTGSDSDIAPLKIVTIDGVTVIVQPPLLEKKPEVVQLLTELESRSIIGFGQHPPVFDDQSEAAKPASAVKPNT